MFIFSLCSGFVTFLIWSSFDIICIVNLRCIYFPPRFTTSSLSHLCYRTIDWSLVIFTELCYVLCMRYWWRRWCFWAFHWEMFAYRPSYICYSLLSVSFYMLPILGFGPCLTLIDYHLISSPFVNLVTENGG